MLGWNLVRRTPFILFETFIMTCSRRFSLRRLTLLFAGFMLLAAMASTSNGKEPAVKLDDATEQQCLKVLRAGMMGIDEEFWPAIHAAEGLTLGGHGDEVIAFLKPRLPQEKDDQHRCGIARELVRAGHRDALKVLAEILAGEDDYGRTHAAESLYKVNSLGNKKAMRRAFKKENLRCQAMAAAALGRQGDKQAMQFLRDLLSNEDPEIFKLGVWVLGRIGDKTDIPRLKKNIDRSPDALTRAYHEHSLATLGDAEGMKALLRNLSSDDPNVRTFAATFSGDAHAVAAAPQLKKMLTDTHLDARLRAAQSLLVLSR